MKKEIHNTALGDSGKKRGLFCPTDWTLIERLKETPQADQRLDLDFLAKKYWAPIVQYLLIQGYEHVESQDLAQDFFAFALETQLFTKANRQRGRFRSPSGGLASVEGLAELGYLQPKGLVNKETPESIFHRAWLREVVRNVLDRLDHEFRMSGKTTHVFLFRSRVVAPELDGDEPPSLQDQARALGLQYKEAANQIVTAKRAFLRILEEEIRAYATSEELLQEKRDVLALLKVDSI
jgi:hypothetical protein